MKYRAKKWRNTPIKPRSELLFVIRIQGINDIHPLTRMILRSLGLWKVFTGVFLKADEGTLARLQRAEPYIAYGYPNLKNVREIVLKKDLARINKENGSSH